MSLPIFQTQNKDITLLQTTWSSSLNQLLAKPLSDSNFLDNISVVSGDNVINHKLGRNIKGWIVCMMHTSFVQLYDKQLTNQMSDKTLILNSNGSSTISLIVF